MKDEGRRLTLASVAREAGLKYGQIVYASATRTVSSKRLRRSRRLRPQPPKLLTKTVARFRETATA